MKNDFTNFMKIFLLALCMTFSIPAVAEINWGRALQALVEGAQAVTLTDSQMASYVSQSVAQMDAQNKVLPASSPYVKRLARLTANCKDADGIPLNFKVYQTKEVNAFACPDGSVRVYTGLMDIMDDNELMGVVGHEIGHVLKRHSRKALRNQLLSGAFRDALASTSGTVAVLTDSQLAAIGQTLLNAKYSRKQESEADDCGYDFLVKNGLNPWGMVSAFQKLDSSNQGSKTNSFLNMFSSHPDTQKRIKAMTARCKKDGIPRPVK